MLTPGDEYPIHQTPEPIAFSGSDRNFYDRYFYNGYSKDGSIFFAAAFGVYPHLNIMDGAVSILKDGVQKSIHVSRVMNMDRMNTQVGPMRIEVIEPLKRVRVILEETEGLALDMEFSARAFPVQEPRFTYRQGSRMLIDCTRMTQNGHWSGEMKVDGETVSAGDKEFWGTRDRSWGVRPIGAADPQPITPARPPQYYWVWTPLNFEDRAVYFHVNDDALGKSWNTRALVAMDGAGHDELEHMAACSCDVDFETGTRRAKSGRVNLIDDAGRAMHVDLTPEAVFQMKGIGYGHPEWPHGAYKGEQLAITREDFTPSEMSWTDPTNLHIQAISKAVLTDADGQTHVGRGSFEQLFMGPHAPSGFKSILDGAT